MRRKIPAEFSIEKVRLIQLELSKKIIKKDVFSKEIEYVAGVDVAYTDERAIGAVAVLDFSSLSQVEVKTAVVKSRFPYIPTLLSFRELHPALSAIRKLEQSPDVYLVDGHGLAHPYRLGFASHWGLIVKKPTIGVAKNILCGRVEKVPKKVGDVAFIRDDREIIGVALLTKEKGKPVYISIGHMISLETAVEIVKKCIRKYRLPEPIRAAHLAANELKRKLAQKH
ncbi:deoxyribonuclease V [Candidatus Bathyarchaeota archaeon]|nr:deoxyribonuclease V [Candidatus Bathyarchaeota archaeon]